MATHNISPYLTEKTLALAKSGKYTFLLQSPQSATQVATTVKTLYDVHPMNVAIVKNAAKQKGLGKTLRTRAGRVKAIVTVKKGEKIADFVVETAKEEKQAKATQKGSV